MLTCGEFLASMLEAYGIDTAFGIPGTHTIELYRGLSQTSIRHVTPRHEQGAGFMADGYARVTGRPAACFTVSGPGAFNIATIDVSVKDIKDDDGFGTLNAGIVMDIWDFSLFGRVRF